MITKAIDSLFASIAPQYAVKRARARAVLRGYAGAEPSRLADHRKPANRPADMELSGPFGAARMRAWARDLVRNNAYAWGAVDTIVASVVGTGIKIQSAMETQDGEDIELTNEMRDSLWDRWCETCELTGQHNFDELQAICQREMAEAGECLVHMVSVPLNFRGIRRPIPFALELIEADRLAEDRDTYQFANAAGTRIVGGVELDDLGTPVAYWVYPAHPQDLHSFRREPVRIAAENILHLFRRDRIGQNRGVTWFAPVIASIRDLGLYLDNEMQAGAVAACASLVVKSESPIGGLHPPSTSGTTDRNGNQYSHMEPGAFFYLNPGEDVAMVNPARPNSGAEPWINMMLRQIAVGTGLSYEIVARDFSQTNYSSNRASQLEDRRRFRRWQQYLINHLCSPVWKRFCFSAAISGHVAFPSISQLVEDFERFAPAEFMPQSWEWVDPATEQKSSQAAITAMQATYSDELGANGKNWRHVFYQRAKEEALLKKLGLTSPAAQAEALVSAQQANASHAQEQSTQSVEPERKEGGEECDCKKVERIERNCGIGSGGFEKGNECAKGGGKSNIANPKSTKKQMSEVAKRAQKHHKVTDASVQREADESERALAKAIGGASFKNSEPIDIVIAGKDGSVAHGIEHKYMQDNSRNKIDMNRYAQVRKVAWEQRNKAPVHTVVESKSGEMFYRRGVGSFRVGGMHKITGGKKELQKLMGMSDDALPAAARRTDSKIREGRWVENKNGKGFRNTKTGEVVEPKKKAVKT